MSGFVLTKKARADLRGIQKYSVERWGKRVARRYAADLDAGFRRAAARPDRGKVVSFRRSCWRVRVRRHDIYYRQLPDGRVEIVRILHQKQKPERHV